MPTPDNGELLDQALLLHVQLYSGNIGSNAPVHASHVSQFPAAILSFWPLFPRASRCAAYGTHSLVVWKTIQGLMHMSTSSATALYDDMKPARSAMVCSAAELRPRTLITTAGTGTGEKPNQDPLEMVHVSCDRKTLEEHMA